MCGREGWGGLMGSGDGDGDAMEKERSLGMGNARRFFF